MEPAIHSLHQLFQQLGLPADTRAIDQFIRRHAPLPAHIAIEEADFWNAAQAAFLRESRDEDADWAELVDELDARLRH